MYDSYDEVMGRRQEIITKALGIDYSQFEQGPMVFDYEGMMDRVGYSLSDVRAIQQSVAVGSTPLIELNNITRLARSLAPAGKGARIFLKDEACNPSGSFKARRAALSVYEAERKGYPGVIAATSGNYGAALASQAAMRGLKCLIVQEVFDSHWVGQPEILEKGRKCEAYGAEVLQLTVGPELFYLMLCLLEETGFFNASLYTPFGIAGIETIGFELAEQVRSVTGRDPDMVVVTHAGGGNVTGTARGLLKAESENTQVVGASVDLSGLHMASDRDFNRKSFTTGHTGFGVPFATWPDRADVPRNAARSLRYLDRYVLTHQGEVFYITELLAVLEGLERGPAGNTALAAALSLAQEMDQDQVLVVQESEYTGAGKHPSAQLSFARERGIDVRRGDPEASVPGESIIIPQKPDQVRAREFSLDKMRRSLVRNAVRESGIKIAGEREVRYLADETKRDVNWIREQLLELGVQLEEV